MAEATLELRTILEAAERAAAAEDFVSAEQHLRQAATLQERQLGAGHPDLANTLNNLGIVSEYVGKPADAEACYRRAYRIAAAALPAEHPLVQTSGQNLRDFCEATGKPFELREELPELEPFASEAAVPRPQPKLAPVPPPAPAKPAPQFVIPDPPPAASAPPQFVMPDLPLRTGGDRTPEQAARQATSAKRTAYPVSPSSNWYWHSRSLRGGSNSASRLDPRQPHRAMKPRRHLETR
jgi:tetratricopeptide repeat protein